MIEPNGLVSILIPVYNRERYIKQCMDSALNQTYKNIEIVVTDNNSTDNSLKIVQEYAAIDPRIKIYANDKNVGPVKNWQIGLSKCNGLLVKILWSDDLITDTYIENCLKLFEDDTSFVISGYEVFDEEDNNKIIEVSRFNTQSEYTTDEYLYNILIFDKFNFPVSPGNAIFRAKDLREVFLLDIPNTENLDFKKYGAGNDLWIFLAIAIKYKKIAINTLTESLFRHHSHSITVERKEEIAKYYEWAKAYFIKTRYPKLSNDFKTRLFLAKLKRSGLNKIYLYASGRPSIYSLFKYLFRRLL